MILLTCCLLMISIVKLNKVFVGSAEVEIRVAVDL
jgi:hypothetical protein